MICSKPCPMLWRGLKVRLPSTHPEVSFKSFVRLTRLHHQVDTLTAHGHPGVAAVPQPAMQAATMTSAYLHIHLHPLPRLGRQRRQLRHGQGLEMGHSMASKLMLGVVVPLRGGVLALALAALLCKCNSFLMAWLLQTTLQTCHGLLQVRMDSNYQWGATKCWKERIE